MKVKYRTINPAWEDDLAKLAKLAATRSVPERLRESDDDFCRNRLAGVEKFIIYEGEMVHVNYEEFYGIVLDNDGYYHKTDLSNIQVMH